MNIPKLPKGYRILGYGREENGKEPQEKSLIGLGKYTGKWIRSSAPYYYRGTDKLVIYICPESEYKRLKDRFKPIQTPEIFKRILEL